MARLHPFTARDCSTWVRLPRLRAQTTDPTRRLPVDRLNIALFRSETLEGGGAFILLSIEGECQGQSRHGRQTVDII